MVRARGPTHYDAPATPGKLAGPQGAGTGAAIATQPTRYLNSRPDWRMAGVRARSNGKVSPPGAPRLPKGCP